MADNDHQYALPKTDPCYATIEAYKQYLAPFINDFWQVTLYRYFAADLKQVQYCCPGGKQTLAKTPADKPIPKSIDEIPLPPVFAGSSSCSSAINAERYRWREDYSDSREQYWKDYYDSLDKNLHACCADRFNACLAEAARTTGDAAGESATGEAFARCSEILTPGAFISPTLITLGAFALLAGFFLGLPGRTRQRTKLIAGATSALAALLIYLIGVAFLPDTRLPYLLLALTVAIAAVTIRTWVRIRLEHRGSG